MGYAKMGKSAFGTKKYFLNFLLSNRMVSEGQSSFLLF